MKINLPNDAIFDKSNGQQKMNIHEFENPLQIKSSNNLFLTPNQSKNKYESSQIQISSKRTTPETELNSQTEIPHNIKEKNISTYGRWNKIEQKQFFLAIQKYGKKWEDIEKVVKTRTATQLRSHFQKLVDKLKIKHQIIDTIEWIKGTDIETLMTYALNQKSELLEDVNSEILSQSDNFKPMAENQKENKEFFLDFPFSKLENMTDFDYMISMNKSLWKLFDYILKGELSIELIGLLLKIRIHCSNKVRIGEESIIMREFYRQLQIVVSRKICELESKFAEIFKALNISVYNSSLPFMNRSSSFQINNLYKVFKLKQYISM